MTIRSQDDRTEKLISGFLKQVSLLEEIGGRRNGSTTEWREGKFKSPRIERGRVALSASESSLVPRKRADQLLDRGDKDDRYDPIYRPMPHDGDTARAAPIAKVIPPTPHNQHHLDGPLPLQPATSAISTNPGSARTQTDRSTAHPQPFLLLYQTAWWSVACGARGGRSRLPRSCSMWDRIRSALDDGRRTMEELGHTRNYRVCSAAAIGARLLGACPT